MNVRIYLFLRSRVLFVFSLFLLTACGHQEKDSFLTEYRNLLEKEFSDEENVANAENQLKLIQDYKESGAFSADQAHYACAMTHFILSVNTQKAAQECLPILNSSFLENNDTCRMNVFLILDRYYYKEKKYKESFEYGYKGLALAKELGDSILTAVFNFSIIEAMADFGSSYYYDELEELIPVMEKSKKALVQRFLISAYADEIEDLMDIEEYERTVQYAERCLKLLDRLEKTPQTEARQCMVASYQARAYLALGQSEKAQSAILKAQQTNFAKTQPGSYYLVGYYLDTHQLNQISPLLNFKQNPTYGDTITWEYMMLLNDLQVYCTQTRQTEEATRLGMRMDVVRDSIVHMEHDLQVAKNAIFSDMKVDEMREKMEKSQLYQQILAGALAVLLLICFCLLLYSIQLRRRQNREKNRKIVEMNERTNGYYNRIIYLEQKDAEAQEIVPDEIKDESEFSKEEQQQLISRMNALIVNEKLYLEENLTREDMARLLHVDKQELMLAIRNELNDVTMPSLFNHYRIQHATELMKEHANYTIQAIAQESGFTNVRKFYRIFKEELGMTPSEYRESLS